MKISAVPSVVNAMTIATQQTTNGDAVPDPTPEALPISDTNEAKPEATQPLSPQFAELARRRRALQQKERALIDKEKALAEKATGSGGIDPARLKSETLKVLQEADVLGPEFYNQMTEYLLGNQSNAELIALKAEIKALKEGVDQKFVEKDTVARQQAVSEIKRSIEQIASQSDKFKLVVAQRKIPDVVKLIERTYDEEGWLMSETQALEEFEAALREDYNRIRSLYEPPAPAPQPQPQQQVGMRTLKNRDTASVALSRRARALAAFHNQNK